MAVIPTAPPPPPPLQRFGVTIKSSPPPPSPPPPPGRITDTNALLTESSQPPLSKLPAASDDTDSLDGLADTEVDDEPSDLVTSSVSTHSPNAETDESEVSSTPARLASPSEETTAGAHPTAHADDDDLLHDTLVPRPAIAKSEGLLSTSSMASSPRRPQRAGTGIPENTRVSDLDFEVSDDIGPSARDEFEEEFLNRSAADRESQIISDVLERVDFRQLSDDEEVLSDDAADSSRGGTAARRTSERSKQAKQRRRSNLDSVELRHIRQSTVRSNWRRIPSEVGCEDCEGCDRLCEENRKLRRQLDEQEFELASAVLHNPPDGFSPLGVGRPISATSQVPTVSKKKKGWTNKLRNATALSVTSSKPGERSRLKAEVQALSVTTEYLWRKLNKAENELRNYRLSDLRNRMEKSTAHRTNRENDGAITRGRHLDLVGDDDWDWE